MTMLDCHKCFVKHSEKTSHYGLCSACWVKLTPDQRAVLSDTESPVREVVEHRTVEHRYSEGSPLTVFVLWAWRIGVSVVLAMLWRKVNTP